MFELALLRLQDVRKSFDLQQQNESVPEGTGLCDYIVVPETVDDLRHTVGIGGAVTTALAAYFRRAGHVL